ncbi:hypothetical protein Smp_102650 [Schistosoma mansoni]|uniref:hypothetical protein n=1 Tax=Schistosoma mansoni TaxID=6183 RepID=UPI00022DC835|nr:hypothetical protein Smp_102650 [Schistosoma mansoni]|eukprot:XP_018652260.1 hypothetical protein Smp_102650 [Schistosoma mansoni]
MLKNEFMKSEVNAAILLYFYLKYNLFFLKRHNLLIFIIIIGTPNERSWPGVTSHPDYSKSLKYGPYPGEPGGLSHLTPRLSRRAHRLMAELLVFPGIQRISAMKALKHEYFTDSSRFPFHTFNSLSADSSVFDVPGVRLACDPGRSASLPTNRMSTSSYFSSTNGYNNNNIVRCTNSQLKVNPHHRHSQIEMNNLMKHRNNHDYYRNQMSAFESNYPLPAISNSRSFINSDFVLGPTKFNDQHQIKPIIGSTIIGLDVTNCTTSISNNINETSNNTTTVVYKPQTINRSNWLNIGRQSSVSLSLSDKFPRGK